MMWRVNTMSELANCSNCNAVFVKHVRDVCQKCYQVEEEAFEIVYRFLMKRKNREATIIEIVEKTGVKEELIIKFVKENRLRTAQFPNLAYPCERCSVPIHTGRICNDCFKQLTRDLNQEKEIEEQISKRKQVEREQENVYNTIKTENQHRK